jgi:hypothetical protein
LQSGSPGRAGARIPFSPGRDCFCATRSPGQAQAQGMDRQTDAVTALAKHLGPLPTCKGCRQSGGLSSQPEEHCEASALVGRARACPGTCAGGTGLSRFSITSVSSSPDPATCFSGARSARRTGFQAGRVLVQWRSVPKRWADDGGRVRRVEGRAMGAGRTTAGQGG